MIWDVFAGKMSLFPHSSPLCTLKRRSHIKLPVRTQGHVPVRLDMPTHKNRPQDATALLQPFQLERNQHLR